MTDDLHGKEVALFDMDGTLLPWDTQYLFSCFVVRRHPWRRLFLLFYLLCLPLYVLRIWDETRMKRAYLSYLWGLSGETVHQYGKEFAAQVVDRWIYPSLKVRLRHHQERGDWCALVSASPSFYAVPIGRLLGFDVVLGTDVHLGRRVALMPTLPVGNNKGEVKVQRLRDMGALPPTGVHEHAVAYSDSSADLPMLLRCRRQVLVNPSVELIQQLQLSGAERVFPVKPWKGRLGKWMKITFFVIGLSNINH